MAGTFYINCWASLGSFAIYFLLIFQTARTPSEILIQSFTVAFVVFIVTFIVRFLIGYAFYTPQLEENVVEEHTEELQEESSTNQTVKIEKNNIEETQAKEVAQVVKTLMAQEN
ncbi:hypothetical protein [Kurthia huakuii]|uniref:hypothetical protein n=1 Tax=Kurthia huakuii TaxID=1421019 RepID=UPI00049773E7|nr:hypothetical protein [Kurthia huakuii]MBM7698306.1 phosphotransferase system glucose/maltose/N-acetylglucosamine-specific IIC component [Kurthia huakuii]